MLKPATQFVVRFLEVASVLLEFGEAGGIDSRRSRRRRFWQSGLGGQRSERMPSEPLEDEPRESRAKSSRISSIPAVRSFTNCRARRTGSSGLESEPIDSSSLASAADNSANQEVSIHAHEGGLCDL